VRCETPNQHHRNRRRVHGALPELGRQGQSVTKAIIFMAGAIAYAIVAFLTKAGWQKAKDLKAKIP
jgi:hypothetical protein